MVVWSIKEFIYRFGRLWGVLHSGKMDKRILNQQNGLISTADDNSDDESENGETEDEKWQDMKSKKSDLPSEYWHAQKLIKYIKVY